MTKQVVVCRRRQRQIMLVLVRNWRELNIVQIKIGNRRIDLHIRKINHSTLNAKTGNGNLVQGRTGTEGLVAE